MEIELPRPMQIARKMALLSDFDKRFGMGAVVTKKNRPIAFGVNKLKTPGAKYPNLFSVHAEISAIINAETNLINSVIWVYRETADGIPGLAMPCTTCLGAILEAGISKVVYSVSEYPYFVEWKME